MSGQGRMATVPVLIMLLLLFSRPVLAGPAMLRDAITEMRILDPGSKVLFESSDEETISFTVEAMKRASDAGSNTFGLSLEHYLILISAGSEASRWFFDPKSGHFARASPPKLLLYRFKTGDMEALRKKTHIMAEP